MSSGDSISEQKRNLVDEVIRMTRGMHLMKQRLASERPDRAAYGLLFPLLEAPKRATDLAQTIHSDPSTVSRHISHLVEHGFAHRIADQNDGRATLVALTDKGHNFCELMRAERESGLSRLLQSWSDDDAGRFSELLQRFNDDVEAQLPLVMDDLRKVYEKAEAFPQPQHTSPSDKESA